MDSDLVLCYTIGIYKNEGEKHMGDLYTELLVKKDRTAKDSLIKYGLIGATAVCAFGALFLHIIFLIGAIVFGILWYFMVPKTDLEWEYLFVNGEMDIDMVMAKSKRKRAKSFDLREADLVAPLDSHRMDYYNNNKQMKVLDYSSGNPQHKRYAVITRLDNAACKIIIEPDNNLVELMKKSAPSKVFSE